MDGLMRTWTEYNWNLKGYMKIVWGSHFHALLENGGTQIYQISRLIGIPDIYRESVMCGNSGTEYKDGKWIK